MFVTEGREVSLGGLTLAGNGALSQKSHCAPPHAVCFNLIQLFSMRKHPVGCVGGGGGVVESCRILFSESHPLSSNNGILSFFLLNIAIRFQFGPFVF